MDEKNLACCLTDDSAEDSAVVMTEDAEDTEDTTICKYKEKKRSRSLHNIPSASGDYSKAVPKKVVTFKTNQKVLSMFTNNQKITLKKLR